MAVVKLTTENFDQEVLQAGQTVLVDFYADWCGPCKMMGPVVEEIANEETGVRCARSILMKRWQSHEIRCYEYSYIYRI